MAAHIERAGPIGRAARLLAALLSGWLLVRFIVGYGDLAPPQDPGLYAVALGGVIVLPIATRRIRLIAAGITLPAVIVLDYLLFRESDDSRRRPKSETSDSIW